MFLKAPPPTTLAHLPLAPPGRVSPPPSVSVYFLLRPRCPTASVFTSARTADALASKDLQAPSFESQPRLSSPHRQRLPFHRFLQSPPSPPSIPGFWGHGLTSTSLQEWISPQTSLGSDRHSDKAQTQRPGETLASGLLENLRPGGRSGLLDSAQWGRNHRQAREGGQAVLLRQVLPEHSRIRAGSQYCRQQRHKPQALSLDQAVCFCH